MFSFPSAEWVLAYKDSLNASEGYRKAGSTWTYGAVALVTKADPAIGIPDAVGIWLDLNQGVCREARVVTPEEAAKAPFCITAEYTRWKQVLRKQIDPMQGMMQKKLELRGQMTLLVRYVQAAKEMIEAAQRVPTKFVDE